MTLPAMSPLGDSAIALRFGEGISEALSDTVVSRAQSIRNAQIIGVTDVVPSYATLTVFYDAVMIGYDDVRRRIAAVLGESDDHAGHAAASSTLHRIPVVYDGEDLEEVASRTGLTADDVVSIHSGTEYRVFVTGFVPGFAYLGVLDERLALPRRESPRKRVPPGSVAIAERQTGVYPSASPGGWHLLGTTAERMFEATRNPPSLLQVGDRVVFEPIA